MDLWVRILKLVKISIIHKIVLETQYSLEFQKDFLL